MQVKRRFKEKNPTTPSFEVITALVREVFGTYFLEETDWSFPNEGQIIGRTYFADRKKAKCAVNDKTVDHLLYIYELAFHGQHSKNPTRVSENLVRMLKEQYNIDVSYAMFFDDDNAHQRESKIRMLRAIVREIAYTARNEEFIDPDYFDFATGYIRRKGLAFLIGSSRGTYTETVIQEMYKSDTI